MKWFAHNKKNIWLDDQLEAYECVNLTPEYVVYDLFLHQLHLPTDVWKYGPNQNGNGFVKQTNEMELMDKIRFGDLDYTKLVSPVRLYTYYLIQQYFGIKSFFSGIGLIYERKTRFVFLNRGIVLEEMEGMKFSQNDLSYWMLKKARFKDLKAAHESFFVLLDDKFKAKILNALILFQSETGIEVEKGQLIDTVLNPQRLKALKEFSAELIGL